MDLSNFSVNFTDNSISVIYGELWLKDYVFESVWTYFSSFGHHPWICSLIGSMLIGLSGVLPLLIIPHNTEDNVTSGTGSKTLRVLLSFAVGGLLGDVFLHLLPEAWDRSSESKNGVKSHPSMFSGLWVLTGMLLFVFLEKLITTLQVKQVNKMDQIKTVKKTQNNNLLVCNNHESKTDGEEVSTGVSRQVSGYLNLMANSIDNFTHGLAVGSSFCISFRLGALSTFAILIHEIPHEVGDFAILLRSGFTRWEAARAQLCTAFAGMVGSWFAVAYGAPADNDPHTSWILPFTAGGFLHIALVTVLPELIKEESPVESIKHFLSLVSGILVMAFLTIVFD